MTVESIIAPRCRVESEPTLALQANDDTGDIIVGAVDGVTFRHRKAFTGPAGASEDCVDLSCLVRDVSDQQQHEAATTT